jgi:hypothetical protein
LVLFSSKVIWYAYIYIYYVIWVLSRTVLMYHTRKQSVRQSTYIYIPICSVCFNSIYRYYIEMYGNIFLFLFLHSLLKSLKNNIFEWQYTLIIVSFTFLSGMPIDAWKFLEKYSPSEYTKLKVYAPTAAIRKSKKHEYNIQVLSKS